MNKLINDHIQEFTIYYNYLVQENEKYNLTSITDKDEAFIKHFEDSISLGQYIDLSNKTLCDVGSGAGFPAIPLKICYPELKITIIEPTMKRVMFMKNVIELLELKDITVICGRGEDLAKDINYREKFDIVCARAVANLSQLIEILVGFVKVNGLICAYKGDKGNEEAIFASNAIKTLSCKLNRIEEYKLSINKDGEDLEIGTHSLIMIEKNQKTNIKYPRRYAEIKKNPL